MAEPSPALLEPIVGLVQAVAGDGDAGKPAVQVREVHRLLVGLAVPRAACSDGNAGGWDFLARLKAHVWRPACSGEPARNNTYRA